MRAISNESNITLRADAISTRFSIVSSIGQGASCVAYKVTYKEADDIKHFGILKEYCPAYLKDYGKVRNANGSLIIPEELSKQFFAELSKFKDAYIAINEYLLENPEAANYHPVQLGLFEGNNTLYTLVSCEYGTSYDNLQDASLKSLLNLMLSVTKGVELYHNAGFLHLDIKPENIFILNDVTELVKLFDYDSLTPIEDIKTRKIRAVPCPGVYYVPELNQRNLRSIGITTDIFEIGAMLFLRLFGRAPESQDRTYDAVYDFSNVALLKGVSPKVLYELEMLFRHTLQTSVLNRYQSTQELKQQLETLITLVDSKKPYLQNMPKWQPSAHYVGRNAEVAEIHRRLQSDGYVFIKGIGGLGKSELAKIYAKEYAEYYHTVVFCKYTDSLAELTAALPIQGVNTDDYTDFDKLVQDKNNILHDCDAHTLLIVDNFNVTYDKFLRDFLPAGNDSFKVIFTTRCTQAAEYYDEKTYHLPKLTYDACERLFLHKAGLIDSFADENTVRQIIKTIDRNTLILVLLAAAVKRTNMPLSDVMSKLDNQELDAIQPDLFHEYDYDTSETEAYNKLLSHLYAVFSISALSVNEVEVLKCMTLIDPEGIPINELIEHCKSPAVSETTINSLVSQSWLFENNDSSVSMHPTVSDLIANNGKIQKQQSYNNLAEALEDYCNPDYISHISVVLSRLSAAVQLLRRYKTESLDKRIMMTAKLGRLYANIYRPTEARKFLEESVKLTTGSEHEYFLPYLYSFFGEFEKDFGTITAAIRYYEQSIQYGKKPSIRYYEIVCESMIDIGECYLENKQYEAAYKQLREALRMVRFHRYSDKIASIALPMIEICRELNLPGKERKYQALYEQYKKAGGYDEVPDYKIFNQFDEHAKSGNMGEMLRVYNRYLAQKKEEFGEDSPQYKDLAQGRWMNHFFNGDKEGAIRAVTEDLSFVAETYGEVSMEMADRLIVIAGVFPVFGEFEYAENAAKRAIDICEKLKERHSFTYFHAKITLAQVYVPQNRIDEAKQVISDVDLSSFKGNEVLSDVISSAGFVFSELDMPEKIEPLCVEYLSCKNTDTFSRIVANVILSLVKEHKGDFDAAEHYAEEAKRDIDNLPDKNVAKLYSFYFYRPSARLAFRRGDCKKAIMLLQELLSARTEEEKKHYSFSVVYLEMGLYFACAGDMKSSEKAYARAKEILDYNKMPQESYVGLYNNIAHQLVMNGQFEEAKKYLDKILKIQPDVIKPKTLLEAIICGNIAWTLANITKKNTEYALDLNQRSIRYFEKTGSQKLSEYATVLNNQALICYETERFNKAIPAFEALIKATDNNSSLLDTSTLILRYKLYLLSMLNAKRGRDAYTFAKERVKILSDRYGNSSELYAEFIMEMGAAFGASYYEDCAEFYHISEESLKAGGHTETVCYAKLLNYIGVYLADFKEKYDRSLSFFHQAKELFEKLNAQDEEAYKMAIENIKYAENKQQEEFDKLIAEMAKTIVGTETEDEES